VEHGIRIVIARGPVLVRIGSTSGGDEYVSETTLNTGTHSISIVPAGNFFIRFFSRLLRQTSSKLHDRSGWRRDASHALGRRRPVQRALGPVRRCPVRGLQGNQAAAHRAARHSPCMPGRGPSSNTRPTAARSTCRTRRPSPSRPALISGNISLASVPMFKTTHIGALFSITSAGQDVKKTAAANGLFTGSIRVTGVGNDRAFSVIISGDATGSTVTLQRSFDNATWANVSGTGLGPWTADIVTSVNDGLNNQIVYYRLILTTRVAPDSVTMELASARAACAGSCVSPTSPTARKSAPKCSPAWAAHAASADWQGGYVVGQEWLADRRALSRGPPVVGRHQRRVGVDLGRV
jgi:hypothetical protein